VAASDVNSVAATVTPVAMIRKLFIGNLVIFNSCLALLAA
jgi:hypothetical protein